MTVSGLDILFDNPPHLPTLSDQDENVFSADDFASNPRFHLLLYHRCRPRLLPYPAVNVFSIDKPSDRCSHSTSSSTSSQTTVGADTPWIHNSRPCYFYNSCHHLDMADNVKRMNQKLLRSEDWVSPTVPDSKKEFAKLPTMDILMIRAASFNTLVQQASHAKNIEIFNILIRNIEKALAPKSTIDPAKKLLTEYCDFLNIFF